MKQAKVSPSTHEYIKEIVDTRNLKNPAMKWTIQGVIADMVIKTHRRECRK